MKNEMEEGSDLSVDEFGKGTSFFGELKADFILIYERAKLLKAGFLAKLLLSVRSWRKKLRARSCKGFGCSTSDVKRCASCLSYKLANRVSGVGWWA